MLSFKNRETDPNSNILRILVYFQSYETLKECWFKGIYIFNKVCRILAREHLLQDEGIQNIKV